MTIQSEDIKLLKSAVMADVPEGGGAATGIEVVDGQSNNIFPDTSTDDRAAGRVSMRKLFGVAHTDNTDTLLGASFAVLEPPEDPLVHVTLFETPGWADERDKARELVEQYLVKGPRLACRLFDTHYAGSVVLMLYQVSGINFPAPGDAIVLRNPDGAEQYVRLTKVTISSGTFNASEGSGVVAVAANVATCEIGQPLERDFFGPPIGRVVNETAYAQLYTTSSSAGVAFYGVKPLAAAASVGDRSVVVDGGVYSPIVPAATVEEPLVDLAPLTRRQSLSRTGIASLTLPSKVMTLQPGTVLRLPTAAQPGTVSVTSGSTSFTDDGNGSLLQGTVVVASIDYRGRAVTFLPSSPSYANGAVTVSYMPVTPVGAATHSDSLLITSANQGLAFTAAFEPPPAPGTFTISYMAQGRWYDLVDNGNGKLAGAGSSYGTGSINYASGSIAYTMGALPDVGSRVIYQWGDAAQAEAVAVADRPDRLQATFTLPATVLPDTVVVSWQEGGQPKSAVCSAAGVISGDATGTVQYGTVTFKPAKIPDAGSVNVAYETAPAQQTAYNNIGGGNYSTTSSPIVPGTVSVRVPVVPQSGYELPRIVLAYDDGAGILRSSTVGVDGAIGTINYSSGAISIYPTAAADVYELVLQNYPSGGNNMLFYEERILRTAHTINLANISAVIVGYATGSPAAGSESPTLNWGASVPVLTGLSLAVEAMAFAVGGQVYTASGGVLNRGWDIGLGTTTPAGSVTDSGIITVTSPPAAGQDTAITWHNVAQSRAVGKVGQGVFRVETAPIKVGVFQIQAGNLVGSANSSGVISGGGWNGTVDWERGIVTWNRTATYTTGAPWGDWQATNPVAADELTYNAVFLQYLPLDGTLLGLNTARLPLDGKVPIYRPGGQVIVHNTLTTALPNPLTKGTAYSLGRQRVAAVAVRTATGQRVPTNLYTVDFDAGEISVPVGSDISALAQPFTVHHRIEDELLLLRADISGKLDLVAGLTHDYPAGTSYVSSKLRKGDLFARVFNYIEQETWDSTWSDSLQGRAPTANYNQINFPIEVTNRGAITERWAVIFTSATQVRVVGENVGQILTNVSITAPIAPLNPQTGAPYFSISELGWGGGWSVGNVLRFNTAAAGGPVWVVRTVLQGPPSVASDAATIAFRADVDA